MATYLFRKIGIPKYSKNSKLIRNNISMELSPELKVYYYQENQFGFAVFNTLQFRVKFKRIKSINQYFI